MVEKIFLVVVVIIDYIVIAMNLHLYFKESKEERKVSHLFFAVFLTVLAVSIMCKPPVQF